MGRKPCCEKVGLKRGPWTIDEDHKLLNFILTNGIHCWRMVPKLAGLLRCGKSCRLRWINYLRPDLKRGDLSETEENQIIKLHALLGNRWSKIASHFPGRTDNEIKNIWNTRIKKRLRELDSMHKPADIICPSPDQMENELLSCSSSNTNILSSPPEEEQSAVNIIKKVDSTTTTEMAHHHDHQQLLPSVPIEETTGKIPTTTTTTTVEVEEKWVEPVDHDSLFPEWDYFNLHPDIEEEFFLWDMPSHLSLNVP